MAKILVVEDDFDLAKTLRQFLEMQGYSVELSHTGQDANHRLRCYSYDLVLLDWQLPDANGVDICRNLRANRSDTPVLMMTAKKEVDEKETAFDSGVDDYLTKPFNLKELGVRLKAILRRGKLVAPEDRLCIDDLTLDLRSVQLYCGKSEVRLIPKEFGILELLMRNPGQVFSSDQILARVWHADEELSSSVVRVHVKNLRKKLEMHGKGSMLVTVHGFGYKFESAEQPQETVSPEAPVVPEHRHGNC